MIKITYFNRVQQDADADASPSDETDAAEGELCLSWCSSIVEVTVSRLLVVECLFSPALVVTPLKHQKLNYHNVLTLSFPSIFFMPTYTLILYNMSSA